MRLESQEAAGVAVLAVRESSGPPQLLMYPPLLLLKALNNASEDSRPPYEVHPLTSTPLSLPSPTNLLLVSTT